MVAKFAYLFTAALMTLSLLTPSSALHAQDYRELFKKLDSPVVTSKTLPIPSLRLLSTVGFGRETRQVPLHPRRLRCPKSVLKFQYASSRAATMGRSKTR